MSQLVSSGDSIKIWDTSTYDCDYCFESPGSHYTSNSWSCDQGAIVREMYTMILELEILNK